MLALGVVYDDTSISVSMGTYLTKVLGATEFTHAHAAATPLYSGWTADYDRKTQDTTHTFANPAIVLGMLALALVLRWDIAFSVSALSTVLR